MKYAGKNNVVNFIAESSADASSKTAEPPQTGSGNIADQFKTSAAELLNLINAEREKAGVPALKLDKTMVKAANRRAFEITKKYSHDRPDGRSYSTVFAEFKLKPRASAENIAWRSPNFNLAAFNKGFMDSPGHKTNMLNKNYTIVGLGFTKAGDKYYCVELFAGNP